MTEDTSAWTLYWSGDTPQSCIASQSSSDAEAINAIWCDFAAGLKHDARILDLATGNGAVPISLLQNRQSFTVTAVDQADISPLEYLSEPGHLQQVSFIGGVDAAQLPMAEQSFDAITSQFGIEYGELARIAPEIFRVLKPGGSFQLLMHHSESAIVRPNVLLIEELRSCLKAGGLVDAVHTFVKGDFSADELEQQGQIYLNTPGRKTSQISGQLFAAIGKIIALAGQSLDAAALMSNDIISRVRAEHSRLCQMQKASLNESAIAQFRQQLIACGLTANRPTAIMVGEEGEEALIGWLVTGTKP